MKDPKKILDATLKRNFISQHPANYDELLKLVSASISGRFKLQNVCKNAIPKFAESNREGDLVEIYDKIISIGIRTTLEKMQLYYGAIIGKQKFDAYRERQAETNSFEYKSKTHGMTREEFDSYNSSRSCSRENFIRRYGEEDGAVKFTAYQKLQAHVGVSIEYFIEKYGEEQGPLVFEDVKRRKAPTLANFVEKYGEEQGTIRFKEYVHTLGKTRNVSKISQEFLWGVFKMLGISSDDAYFSELNQEFGKLDHKTGGYYFYDFVIPSAKIVLEFNGDIYHANPKTYLAEEIPPFRGNTRTSSEIWEYDRVKRLRMESEGFSYIVVWESDYNADKPATIAKTVKEIKDAVLRNK